MAEDLWEEVIDGMRRRRDVGLERYGRAVQSFNGKDAISEAQEELLDGIVYLEQARKEARLLGEELLMLWNHMLEDGEKDGALAGLEYSIRLGSMLVKYKKLLQLKECGSVQDPTEKEADSAD